MLPVSEDFQFLIDTAVYSNIYECNLMEITGHLMHYHISCLMINFSRITGNTYLYSENHL